MRNLCISLPSSSLAASSSSKSKSSSSSSSSEAADGRPGPRAKSMEVVADVRAKNDNGLLTNGDGCSCFWCCSWTLCADWYCNVDRLLCTAVSGGANAWSRVGTVKATASSRHDGVAANDERFRCCECCCLCLFIIVFSMKEEVVVVSSVVTSIEQPTVAYHLLFRTKLAVSIDCSCRWLWVCGETSFKASKTWKEDWRKKLASICTKFRHMLSV